MPELPEVEILVRHLQPLLVGKSIRRLHVLREKVVRPSRVADLERELTGATFRDVTRRGKYLVFCLRRKRAADPLSLLGHLGMTGRMYLQPAREPWPRHAAVVLELGRQHFIFEDTRYFGRFTLDTQTLEGLGPEPLAPDFTPEQLRASLRRSAQSVKTRLLDQRVVAGVGNIYASEAMFRARISPRRKARSLKPPEVSRLWQAVREVLSQAIAAGSTVPLNFSGKGGTDNLFYYGRAEETPDYYEEGLQVYGRAGKPCPACSVPVKRIVQGGRSTFFCPGCQR